MKVIDFYYLLKLKNLLGESRYESIGAIKSHSLYGVWKIELWVCKLVLAQKPII